VRHRTAPKPAACCAVEKVLLWLGSDVRASARAAMAWLVHTSRALASPRWPLFFIRRACTSALPVGQCLRKPTRGAPVRNAYAWHRGAVSGLVPPAPISTASSPARAWRCRPLESYMPLPPPPPPPPRIGDRVQRCVDREPGLCTHFRPWAWLCVRRSWETGCLQRATGAALPPRPSPLARAHRQSLLTLFAPHMHLQSA
jgi:hypothetical protein